MDFIFIYRLGTAKGTHSQHKKQEEEKNTILLQNQLIIISISMMNSVADH